MGISKLLAAVTASLLVTAPVMASPTPSLSVAKALNAKAATISKNSNKLEGSGLLLALVGAVAVVAGIAVVADSDNAPASN